MNMINSNKIGKILERLKLKFKHDNIHSIKKSKQFYDLYINTSKIISELAKRESEDEYCYRFSYEIQYDFRDFTYDDYLYIRYQLSSELSSILKVFVNCDIDTFCRILDGNEIYCVKISVFIRKPKQK